MGTIAIVLVGSIAFFLLGLVARIVLRNEGPRYTEAADQIMQAGLVFPVIYGALVLVIGLAP